ncbi:MAG: hypothetical protein KDC90_13710 [Ignavibacteriae bacterium]|nr:hypothetical protein [Ignavibacteriota bacterium]
MKFSTLLKYLYLLLVYDSNAPIRIGTLLNFFEHDTNLICNPPKDLQCDRNLLGSEGYDFNYNAWAPAGKNILFSGFEPTVGFAESQDKSNFSKTPTIINIGELPYPTALHPFSGGCDITDFKGMFYYFANIPALSRQKVFIQDNIQLANMKDFYLSKGSNIIDIDDFHDQGLFIGTLSGNKEVLRTKFIIKLTIYDGERLGGGAFLIKTVIS